MTNHQYVTVTRTLLKRGVTDIERKLAAACTSGAAAYVLLGILSAYGVKLPVQVAELVPLAVGAFGGYLTHSVGATTHSVVTEPTGRTIETTTTGAIALPVPGASIRQSDIGRPTPEPAPEPDYPADPEPLEVPDQAPTQAFTQVIQPDQSRAGAFLSRLPSATGPTPTADEPASTGWRN